MANRVDFFWLVEAVLAGRCRVLSGDAVPPWPSKGGEALSDEVAIMMHRDCPGVVILSGLFEGRSTLVAVYSERLALFLARVHAEKFNFSALRGVGEMIDFAVSDLSRLARDPAADDSAARFVEGAEGAQLLSELKRVALQDVAPDGATIN